MKLSKKIISAFLVLLLSCSAVVPVFADEARPAPDIAVDSISSIASSIGDMAYASSKGETETLAIAITAVKNILNVDEKIFTHFEYYSYETVYYYDLYAYDYDMNKTDTYEIVKVWQLTWCNDDYSKSLNASVTSEGVVRSMSYYNNASSGYGASFGFAEITKEQASQVGKAILKNAFPDDYENFREPSYVYTYLRSNTYSLDYTYYKNGIPCSFNYVSIEINKFNGEFVRFYNNAELAADINYADPSKALSVEEAAQVYLDKVGISLEYFAVYNENGEIDHVFPAYAWKYTDGYLNALTGEIFNPYDYYSIAKDSIDNEAGGMVAETTMAGQAPYYSEVEKAAIQEVEGFIKSVDAVTALLKDSGLSNLDMDKYVVTYAYLYTGDEYNPARWNIDISVKDYKSLKNGDIYYIYGYVDALTAETEYFYINEYNDGTIEKMPYSYEDMQSIAAAYLEAKYPVEFAQAKFMDTNDYARYPYLSSSNPQNYISFVQYVNGAFFAPNNLNATVSAITGRILSSNKYWTDGIEFPEFEVVVTPEEAILAYVKVNGYSMRYVLSSAKEALLVYDFASYQVSYIDPVTGKLINYDGTEWIEGQQANELYSDTKGTSVESIVNVFVENGVYIPTDENGNVDLGKSVTVSVFLDFVISQGVYNYYGTPMYKIIDQYYKDTTPITIKEVAKLTCLALGYEKIAALDIFSQLLTVKNVGSEYKGYIALCDELDLIDAKSSSFDPNAELTREQGIIMLYNLILHCTTK